MDDNSVQCLPSEHEHLSSGLQKPWNELGTAELARSPSAREHMETGGFLGLPDQQSSQINQLQVQWETQTQNLRQREMMTQKGILLCTHRYMRTHSYASCTFNPLYVCVLYIHTHMCTYTTCMYAHMHSQPNLISEIHTTKRPSLKKQSICKHPKKDTWICPLAVICMCAYMHGHPHTCPPAYAYTDTHQESSRRNAFWKAAVT